MLALRQLAPTFAERSGKDDKFCSLEALPAQTLSRFEVHMRSSHQEEKVELVMSFEAVRTAVSVPKLFMAVCVALFGLEIMSGAPKSGERCHALQAVSSPSQFCLPLHATCQACNGPHVVLSHSEVAH